MGFLRRGLPLAALLSIISGCAATDNPRLPWAFNAPRAEGYAIDLVNVKPAPGTPLAAGTLVEFLVKVNYSLSVASRGTIVLVFENEKNKVKAPEITRRVASPAGEVTLRERITVPDDAKELRLFIPLVPQNAVHTTGEVTIRYPIEH